ncbi:hypothetical protein [Methylobacterium sp. Leaf456]|uniref:hypothetical protein n=1 Tax=Methylobacterium sp. Leaf456 TaxID=1736382 RepID=UPI000AFE4573|nr:hypothetical protein [Methylobacterium sp. Leaf456]
MTDTTPTTERESTAAARRRVAAADRARKWREEQREADATRQAEIDALRAEVADLRAQRDGLEQVAEAATVDEDLVRALVKMGGLHRSPAGPLAIGKPQVSVADVVSVAGYLRCGGRSAGQEVYDAARGRVLDRLAQFVLPRGA